MEGVIVSITLRAFIIAKLILNLLAGIIVTIFIFHVSWKRSIIYNLFFFGLSASVEIVVLLVFQYVFKVNDYSELNNENGAAIMEIISYLIMLLIIVMINLIHKKNLVARLDTKRMDSICYVSGDNPWCHLTFDKYTPRSNLTKGFQNSLCICCMYVVSEHYAILFARKHNAKRGRDIP